MRIYTSFSEMKANEYCITKIPKNIVINIVKDPKYQIEVKIPRRITTISEGFSEWQSLHRHQIVATCNFDRYAKETIEHWEKGYKNSIMPSPDYAKRQASYHFLILKLYSIRLSAKEVKDLGLQPLEKATKEEETAQMLLKINNKNTYAGRIATDFAIPKTIIGVP